ncbi:MAG: HAD family hydrolase [Ignavibacteria bacterium]
MKKYRVTNIVFDLGNTLVFFDHSYFFNGLAEREKKLSAAKFKRYIVKNKLDIKLVSGRMNHREFFRKLKKKFDLRIGYSDFIYFYSDVFWENSAMKRLLEKISRIKKYKLFLLSNTDSPHMSFIDKNFPYVRILNKRVLSYKVHMYKPQKKIFRYLLEKHKLNPDNTVLIDDVKDNVKAAASVGMHTIHYVTHKKFMSEFSKILKLK